MRWVWLTTRDIRLSLSHQHLLPTTGTPLLRPYRADPLLHDQQHVATRGKPRTRLQPLEALSRGPHLPLLEEQAGIEHGKPLNESELLQFYKQTKANEDAEAVQEGDTPDHAKNNESKITAEPADSTKPTKTANVVKTAKPTPRELAEIAYDEKTKECPDPSDPTTVVNDPDIQSAAHALTFSDYNRTQEPLTTTSSDYTGFSIDGRGQLRIKSTAAALRKTRTALIVSSVSRNLLEADFTRLLAHIPDLGTDQSGFVRAIPGRDEDFNRLSYWILLFDSPYTAASFQRRLRWYHANATLNLPVNPHTAATTNKRELTPPEGYVDPLSEEDIWKRLHEFSVLLPTQLFDVTAMLEPFPQAVQTNIKNHELWRFPNLRSKSWPVRIRIDDYHLDASLVKRFLEEDGNKRGQEWKLTGGNKSVDPMLYTAFNKRGDRIYRTGRQISKDDVKLLRKSPQKNWVIHFRAKEDALLFWRTWQRRPLPESLSRSLGEKHLLRVDPLW